MSIKCTYLFPTSYMFWTTFWRPFLMKVDPVEINQRTKLFYPSFVPSMVDDAVINVSSSRETTKTSKIRLPPWSLLCVHRIIYIQISNIMWLTIHASCDVLLLHIRSPLYLFCAPPASSTAMLMWIAKLEWARSFQHWFSARMSRSGDEIKRTSESLKFLFF